MKLRPVLRSSTLACSFALGVTALFVTACGDDEPNIVTTVDAGNPLTPTGTSESSGTFTDTQSTGGGATSAEISAPVTADSTSTDGSNAGTSADESTLSVATESTAATASVTGETSSAPIAPTSDETSSAPVVVDTTEVIEPCNAPSFSVFTRSDSEASWDDNDFSSVVVDGSQCPPAVYVDATWPHEADWANGDPSEANHEQVHFTLDSYGASNLVDKEITATVELVADERGPNANAGGYLVSIVSVSTFDRITVLPGVVEPDAGPDASPPEPQTLTETGYTEAESPLRDRILLRRAGDRATISFRLPAKTEAVDSYDPERVLKINLRFYNVYDGVAPAPVEPEPLDAGAYTALDAAVSLADASVSTTSTETAVEAFVPTPTVEGDPSLVYEYVSSRFAITKFTVSDVAGTVAQ